MPADASASAARAGSTVRGDPALVICGACTGRSCTRHDLLHGVRVEGVLPLALVARLERVDAALPNWRRRHGVASRDTLLVTPFDKPNCVLVLVDDARVDILHWQATKRLPRYVFLYLDRPELLAARLRRRDQDGA